MPKTLTSLITALFFALSIFSAAAVEVLVDPASLVPTESQRKATHLITRFISTYHYRRTPLDDDLSEQILERYLEALDPSHHYLLAEDIARIGRLEHELDDLLRRAELEAVFETFRLFRSRVEETVDRAQDMVQQEFDFSRDEGYVYDRSEAEWPTHRRERDEIWRKRVKNDVLTLRLTGKDDDEVRETLTKRYHRLARRVGQLSHGDVYQTFMNAYTAAVEPHTSYFSPRTSENFKIHLSLSLEGIGAALRTEDEYTVVQRVIAGGPADKQGELQTDDRITGVAQQDGEMVDVVAWRLEDVVDLIRGPKGSEVRLEVLPEGADPALPRKILRLTRNTIKLEEQAAKKWILDVDTAAGARRIGVVEIPSFYLDSAAESRGDKDFRSTTRDVSRLLAELEGEGVDGIVIDLRGNGGGALTESVRLSGAFIDKGPVVQVRDSRGRTKVENDSDPSILYDGPLAVLVDRYSASASEIFAGAIKDYGRGIIIGEPTYGKGTVQSLVDLDRYVDEEGVALGQLKTTIAQFFRVNGDSTQHRGVQPHVVFPTAFDIEDHGERALKNALPWDNIREASYRPYRFESKLISDLRRLHEQRLAGDPVFGLTMLEARESKRLREEKVVSLNEEKRKRERERREEDREKRTGELRALLGLPEVEEDEDGAVDAAEDKRADVWLNEAARVLADYIDLRTDTGLKLVKRDLPAQSCIFGDC
ncbi:MAG: carboxy terminal-processing peptidase [Gammaproteobacteria bacterium]|nr:carboxy terminal-processing peptidase [Gammaproteobacteria bacterium]